MPKPSVTIVPGTSNPATPPPSAPKQPPVPVYTPPAQNTPPPPVRPPTPVYIPPAQPTVQTNVSPDAQTLQGPRQPIKARPGSLSAANTSTSWGKLIFSNGKEVELTGEQALIGRIDHDVQGITPDVDLSDVPGADTTSRIHATIEHVGSAYMVTDLNSTNATRVNGKRLEPDKASPINDGESLQFGKVSCTFKKL
jgi:pSer/pThr/pTyr-binding forkhead associated (FHA) protein